MIAQQDFYLIDYIKENYPIDKEILEALKFDLDRRLYHYGDQFKSPSENCKNESGLKKIKESIKNILRYGRGLFNQHSINDKPKIISNAYFTYNAELEKLGYDVYLSPWIKQYVRGYPPRSIKREINYIKHYLALKGFNEIISRSFLERIVKTEESFKKYYVKNEVRALCVPYDKPFFENWAIKIFQNINRPSFIFLHGLPQWLDVYESSSDYLIVWGEKIRENYIKKGVNANKIFVSGHPYYKEHKRMSLKFSLENILVLTSPIISFHSYSTGVVLHDRGNSILYLYSVQKILKRLSVKNVKFRPHPSENPAWYNKYIDEDFYKLDLKPLKDSIGQSSLVIGNSSTVFLESIYYGINYVVYEPSVNGYSWGSKCHLAKPFDGSDSRVPVAKNEEELLYILKNIIKVDPAVFHDYIKTPFDLSFMKQLI